MNLGITGEFKSYKDVIEAMKKEYEAKMDVLEKDMEFGRTQLLNYKDETTKLRDTKKVLMATLKKNGIEVPPALLAKITGSSGSGKSGGGSGKDGDIDEPLTDKEIEEMTNKIAKATNKNNPNGKFSAPHSGLDPTQ